MLICTNLFTQLQHSTFRSSSLGNWCGPWDYKLIHLREIWAPGTQRVTPNWLRVRPSTICFLSWMANRLLSVLISPKLIPHNPPRMWGGVFPQPVDWGAYVSLPSTQGHFLNGMTSALSLIHKMFSGHFTSALQHSWVTSLVFLSFLSS